MKQSELRQILTTRLQFLVDRLGSVAAMADIVGINRTQMSRYLSGQSVPRAELLAQIGQELDIPLDWFFGAGDVVEDLTAFKYGAEFQKLIAHREYNISESFLPTGFYIFWKQLFSDTSTTEALLAKVYDEDGVKTLAINMVRDTAKYGNSEEIWEHDRKCRSLLFLSGGNLCMMSLDGLENITIIGLFQRRGFGAQRALSKLYFMGTLYCPTTDALVRAPIVKGVLEKIPDNTSDVLAAARKCTRVPTEDLPTNIRSLM